MAETFSRYASVETYRDDEVEQAVARVEMLAHLMDSVVTIPGTNVRVGLDAFYRHFETTAEEVWT